MTVFPMYVGKVLSIPDRDRVYDTRLRLSSHKLAIETGRWSSIPREDRLCPCGVIQMEEHVICHRLLSDHIRSQFDWTAEITGTGDRSEFKLETVLESSI